MEELKRAAAERAVAEYVESGMVVGLGTGSTASWAVRRIGELLLRGVLLGVRGIPTSEAAAALAREVGIPLTNLSNHVPDVVLDGADEIDPSLNLIKGLGGALLREKIVATAAGGLVVIADKSKRVFSLGQDALPVEVEPFGCEATRRALRVLGCDETLRATGEQPFVTDGGHYIVDCLFDSIPDLERLAAETKTIPGVLETGLFVSLTRAAVIGHESGVTVKEP